MLRSLHAVQQFVVFQIQTSLCQRPIYPGKYLLNIPFNEQLR